MIGAEVEQTARDYEYRLPDHWIDHIRDPDAPFTKLHAYYVDRVIAIILASGARTVLEAGCGDGWNVGRMVEHGLAATGIDWSANAIGYASRLVPGARFHCGDVRDDAFIRAFPEKFDAVALVEVIEHIHPADCVEALRNVIAPLRDGGTFVLTTPHVNFPNHSAQHYRHFTEEMLRDLLAEAGLTVLAVEGYGDVRGDRRYWNRMRWFDNRYYSIKPAVRWLRGRHRYTGPTPLDRAHGLIVTARKG